MAQDQGAGPKPGDSPLRAGRAPQTVWDRLNTGHPALLNEFAYMDRVGPEMFVGRYDYGTCGTVPEKAAEHAPWVKTRSNEPGALKRRNHAYVATVTPDGAESVCIYCGAATEGSPKIGFHSAGDGQPPAKDGGARPWVNLEDIPWDEPYDGPRRATPRELEAMGIRPIPDHRMLYLDEVDGMTWTGRFRVGECPAGGTHEAVLNWWPHSRDPMFSCCAFCGERWDGAPPGFWDVVQPHIKAGEILARHAEDVRRGVY